MTNNPSSHAETARHYGNMRFAMFTVFTTITGALLSFAFSDSSNIFLSIPCQRIGIGIFGIILSVFFALAQQRISTLVVFYQEEAFGVNALAKPEGHSAWSFLASATMILPFIAAFIFWSLLAFDLVQLK